MPAAVDLAGLLAAFLAFLVCYSLLVAYKSTLGALLQTLANAVHSVSVAGIHPLAFLSDGINALDSAINAALSAAVLGTEYAWHRMLHWTATLIHEAVTATADLADATYSAFRHTIEHVIPSLIGSAIRPLYGAVHSLSHQLAYLWRVVTSLAQKVDHAATVTVPKAVTRLIPVTRIEIGKGVKAAEAAIATTLPRVQRVEREATALEKWIRAHTKDLAIGAVSGLLVAAIARDFPWLRCKNNKNLAKHLCSWPIKALEDLLGGVLDYLVISNLCVLLTEMDALASQMLPFIEQATGVIDSVVKCQSSTIARPIKLTRTSVSPPWSKLPL